MVRVVFDTNVFVSSFFGGYPRKAIDLWISGRVLLCLTPPIIEEYIKVLKRLGLGEELKELLMLFERGYNLVFTSDTPRLDVVEDDPEDNKFIEAAVALGAKFVVSGDKHLKALGSYMGIRILPPKDFVALFQES